MYSRIKQIFNKIIPKKIIFKYEPLIRGIYYQLYRGNKFYCAICNKRLSKFIQVPNGDKLCPNCGSSSRDRRLWELLHSGFLKNNIKILDFSPSRSIYRALKKNHLISYTATDLSGNFLSDKNYDITDIEANDEFFDLAICFHVLEHIENDMKAMNELHRILREKGICIVQTPYKEGEIFENPSIKTETERLKHFGQKDHVRIYSVNALKERLSNCGFKVDIRKYKEAPENVDGFESEETILICKK